MLLLIISEKKVLKTVLKNFQTLNRFFIANRKGNRREKKDPERRSFQ